MALMKDTELMLADEPTTALDVTIEEQILELLDQLVREKNKSLILVSHALGAIRKITDRVYVMYAGNIVEAGMTREVFERPKHPYTGEIPSYINPPKGCRFASRCPACTDVCLRAAPELLPVDGEPERYAACYHVGKEVKL